MVACTSDPRGVPSTALPANLLLVQSESPPTRRWPPLAVIVNGLGIEPDAWRCRLEQARATYPNARTLVVLSFDRANATELARVQAVEVVWEDAVDGIRQSLASMVRRQVRELIASRLATFSHQDQVVSHAVWVALRGSDYPVSVTALAKRLFMSQSALRYHWRKSGLPSTPRVLVDWYIACAIADGRIHGHTVEAIAHQLGIHASTVYRICERRIGCSPTSLDAERVLVAVDNWLSTRAG